MDEREDQTRLERVLVRLAVGDLEPAVRVDHELAIDARDQFSLQAEVLFFLLLLPNLVRSRLSADDRTASKTEQTDMGSRADSDRAKGENDAAFRG